MTDQAKVTRILRERGRAHNLHLQGADLANTNLSHLQADELDLRAANLNNARLCETRFGNCRLEVANFENTDWAGATLRLCVLDNAQGAKACFAGARIEDSSLKGADLTRANLRSAKLTETTFERAVLLAAVLDDAEGDGVQFRGAVLSEATLIGARLDEADFRGADLRKANLSRGRFQHADFRGALLDGAQWNDADLSGALFDVNAEPMPRLAPTPASAASPPVGSEHETLARWVEKLLQFVPLETADGTTRQSFPHLHESGDANELQELLKLLEETFASAGLPDIRMISSLPTMIEALERMSESEPPEAWKPLLEKLLTQKPDTNQALDLTEILNVLQEMFSQLPQSAPPPPNHPDAHDAQPPGKEGNTT
jgi:uncharacterized protein YjbI with pentapeptide repeats